MKEMIQLIIAMTSLILDGIRDLHALIQDLRREAEEASDTMRELVRSHESSRAAAQDATAATVRQEMAKVIKGLATKTDVYRAKREVIKVFLTNRNSEAEQDGPRNDIRCQQVEAVKSLMHKAYLEDRQLNLHKACLEAWTPLNGGYPTPKALYEYCHEHENEF